MIPPRDSPLAESHRAGRQTATSRPRRLGPSLPHLAGAGGLLPAAARPHAGALLAPARALRRRGAAAAGRRLGLLSPLGGVPRQLRPLPRRRLPRDRLALALDGGADDRPLPPHRLPRRLLPRPRRPAAGAAAPGRLGRGAVLDQLPHPHLRLDVHPADRGAGQPPAARPGLDPPPARPPLHPARGDDRAGLRRAAVHDPAALRLAREARPVAARGRRRPRRRPLGAPGAGHRAARPAGHRRRRRPRLHPQPRPVRRLGPPRRRAQHAARQPCPEPVRGGPQPALRRRPRLRAHRRGPRPPRRLRALRPRARGRGDLL